MIKTFILHAIYEQCLSTFFKNLNSNFSSPVIDGVSLTGKQISAIETFIENDEQVMKVVYTGVTVQFSDEEGMSIHASYGTMQPYPIEVDGDIYDNTDFTDYIKYEDIVEIFE